MSDERTCHICGTLCREWCPACIANFPKRRDARTMSPHQRASELRLLIGPLEIPFGKLHQRIEELVGRPVWTHELAHPEQLVVEITSGRVATFSDVVGKIPEGKPIIAIVVDQAET